MQREQESLLFNRMADYYDTYRPGYPTAIIDAIVKKANLTAGARLLEIGSGSGKATVQFVDRGFDILCIEPGTDLVEKGRIAFRDKSVAFVNQRFEDYTAPKEFFDTVISAQAFHWVSQPLGYEKCAETLKKGGKIALFWNIDLIQESQTDKEFYNLLERYSAFTSCILEQNYRQRVTSISSAIIGSGFFTEPEVIQAYWEKTYSADEYFHYLLTGQVFLQNSDEKKQACYEELKKFADKHQGIQRRYVCELYMAEKRQK